MNRLQDEEHIEVSERWQDNRTRMFRMGAELAASRTHIFRYALLSNWLVNAQPPDGS